MIYINSCRVPKQGSSCRAAISAITTYARTACYCGDDTSYCIDLTNAYTEGIR